MTFNNRLVIGIICSLALFISNSRVRADVRLPGLFSDDMVLQRGMSVPVWGWGDEGEAVTVTFRGHSLKALVKDGKWMVKFKNLKAGGPDLLTVQGRNKIEVKNVLVGEVWICSGQSNMELALSSSVEASNDIAQAENPKLRLFLVPKTKSDVPLDDVNATWKTSSAQSAPGFSAVAYYFGRDLQKSLGVPVGLIDTCWGGSPAEVWMSEKVLAANPEYRKDILEAYQTALKKQPASGKQARPAWKPAELYNGMIAPLIPYAFQGAIWYQGESNAGRAQQYRTLFPDMIQNWRHDWNEGNFTFLAVQLAPFDKGRKRSLEAITEKPGDSDWAELREAQLLATSKLPNVGMAVITDVGEKDDIHPKKKTPVGARLALAARGIAYHQKIEFSGPVYKSMKTDGNKIILTFDHIGEGLESRDGELKGFEVCGADKKFVWAKAVIDGKKVVVSSPEVANPVAVRYGWSDYPVVNLWNKAGLPATPFRTDDFPMITAPK
jgi:sialate O-acetylesterase